ncbi:DNA polymerase III subunit gamma/tau [candidate division KSB1 bacterium]|nr:MAG: DNA polymerase III subunit gamma/tau [candidate division KSB1 bacterium]
MSYQVIARRWRPKKFSDVVGQEHITRTIQNALRQGRLAHAFLFTGPRGVGKTSTARILARAVNCPNIDLHGEVEPCNECDTCRALFEDREMDVIEMDAASYTSVDDIRRINENCRLSPVAGQRKIYIIDEVHMLSKSAFNAFLKTLEEPPEHVIFILATTDVQKVPATILSRVQRFDFRPVQPADVAPHLKKICESEGWPAEDEALWLIARRAEGSLRDAEGLLDQVVSYAGNQVTLEATREVLGILPGDLMAEATRLLSGHRMAEVPAYLEQLALRGVDYTDLLKAMQGYWMDLVFLKEGLPVSGRMETEMQQMKEAGADLSIEDLFRLIRLAEGLEDALKWSTAPRVRFEVSFLRWATLDRVATIRDILDRLSGGEGSAVPERQAMTASQATAVSSPPPPPAPIVKPAPIKAETTPPTPPVPAAESTPTNAAASGEVDLETLRARWGEILAALRKRNQAAAAMAESSWILDSFDGRKLTVCCTMAGKFATDRMKESLPALAAAITDVCGITPIMAAGAPRTDVVKPVEKLAAKPPAERDDLFNSLMNRFGGVEIDPKKSREPR